jgi:hypothetical protein
MATMIEALILNLKSRDTLSGIETEKLQQIVTNGRNFAPGEDIVTEGSRPGHSTLMIEGLSGRYKQMADGSRQITAAEKARPRDRRAIALPRWFRRPCRVENHYRDDATFDQAALAELDCRRRHQP